MVIKAPTPVGLFQGVKAPDLSHVFQASEELGRMAGDNAYLTQMMEKQKELLEAKSAERETQAKAKQELGNDPDGPGFWSKVADGALDGLSRTIDVLSRGEYAVSNTLKYIFDQDEDAINIDIPFDPVQKLLGKSIFHSFDDFELGDIGGVAKAFWRGVSGKDKTIMQQVVANNAAKDPRWTIHDMEGYQAMAGLGVGIALDPTSYVGLGLIQRPLKIATRGKRPKPKDPEADEAIQEFAKTASEARVNIPDPDTGKLVQLNYDTAYRMLSPTGYKLDSKRRVVGEVKRALGNYQTIRKALHEQLPEAPPEKLRSISREIDELEAGLRREVESYSNKAYADALMNFDPKKAGINKADFQKELVIGLKDTAQAGTIAKAFQTFSKLSRDGKSYEEARAVFDDMLGAGWKADNTIPPALKADAIRATERIVKNQTEYSDTAEAIKAINKQIAENKGARSTLRTQYNSAKKAGNKTDAAEYSRRLNDIDKSLDTLYDTRRRKYSRQDMIKASVFASVVEHARGNGKSNVTTDFLELDSKIARIEDLSRKLADMPEDMSNATVQASKDIDPHADPVLDQVDGTVGNTTVYDERIKLSKELKELTKEVDDAIFGTLREMDVPPRFVGKTVDEIERADPSKLTLEEISFRNAVMDRVDELVDKNYPNHLSRVKKRNRQADRSIPEKHKDAFLDGEPAITVNGEVIALGHGSKTIADKMEHLLKESDVEQARKAIDAQKIDGTPEFINEKIRTRAAMIAFDRLFKDQHGITLKQGRMQAAIANRTGIRLNGPKGEDFAILSKDHLFDILRGVDPDHNLSDIALGMGWTLKDGRTYRKNFQQIPGGAKEWHALFKADIASRSESELRQLAASRFSRLLKSQKKGHVPLARNPTGGEVKIAREAARRDAKEQVQKEIDTGKFKGVAGRAVNFFSREQHTAEELYELAVERAKLDYADAKASAAQQKALDRRNASRINQELQDKKEYLNSVIMAHRGARTEAIKTRREALKRLDEQYLINILNDISVQGHKSLAVGIFGKQFFPFARLSDAMGNPEILTRSMERLSKTAIISKSSELWSNAFHPASKLDPELNLARMRSQHRTPDIIRHHTEELFAKFSKYPPKVLKATARSIMSGAPAGDKELIEAIESTVKDLLPYLNGGVKVGSRDAGTEVTLKLSDINSKLADKKRFELPEAGISVDRATITNAQDFLKMFRRQGNEPDPFQLLWDVRIAAEQALSEIARDVHIAEMFGIRRVELQDTIKIDPTELAARRAVENLRDQHGWRTVGNLKAHLREDFFFPPEVAEEIDKLMEMMKPANFNRSVHAFDTALRAWKAAVTIYNPGYYVRNGIGEFYSSWLDGVHDPRVYSMASKVIKYSKPDKVTEALKSITPWAKYKNDATPGVKLFKHYGRDVTIEDVWVLYHDTGLKTGYISTDFDTMVPQANTFRASAPGQKAHDVNNWVRDKGEAYEDYWRLAHFMNRIQRSSRRDLGEAAKEAAEYVRKYHFDYTDFTPFEKSAMLRVFPFYKWTRKSLPLQISMLFAKPGKILLYPRAMNSLSIATGAVDPMEDNNGFLPNYEEVTPEWMRHLMAYPIGKDAEDNMTYMNMAIPSFDIYKMMADPGNSAVGMLNPMIKAPLELNQGKPLDSGFDYPIDTMGARGEYAMQQTPLTNLLKNIYKGEQGDADSAVMEDGFRMDERLLSFLSGLGFYENNPQRQQGELYRRSRENM